MAGSNIPLKFIKVSSISNINELEEGTIYFENSTRNIHVGTDVSYETFGWTWYEETTD